MAFHMLGINLSLDLEPGLISVLFINTQVKLVRFIIKVTFAGCRQNLQGHFLNRGDCDPAIRMSSYLFENWHGILNICLESQERGAEKVLIYY